VAGGTGAGKDVHGVLGVAHQYREATMDWKKIITWILVIFAIYTVLASPDKAAALVQDAFNGIAAGGESVKRFFDALVA
jgi:hypothetical protein